MNPRGKPATETRIRDANRVLPRSDDGAVACAARCFAATRKQAAALLRP